MAKQRRMHFHDKMSQLPAVFGVEQEIPLYIVKQEVKGRRRIIELNDETVDSFTTDFVKKCYPEAMESYQSWIPGYHADYFVADGRIYVDQGLIELATTECMSPFELATRISVMRDELKSYMCEYNPDLRAYCDSAGLEESVSFHENYYTFLTNRHPLQELSQFLHSRIVITGTGGPTFTDGEGKPSFCLSPRYSFLEFLNSTPYTDPSYGQQFYRATANNRLHILSSDQIMSPATIALQTGITALAIRLYELNELPSAPQLFSLNKDLNGHRPGQQDQFFINAVNYQREVYCRAEEYIDHCIENCSPSIFGNETSTKYLLELWDQRLGLLEQYCQDWDVSALRTTTEWAMKAVLIDAMRRRNGREGKKNMTNQEVMMCNEFTAFVPMTKSIERAQRPFLYCDDSYRDIYFVPRAASRATLLNKFREHQDRLVCRWDGFYKHDGSNNVVEEISMPTPFCGLKSIGTDAHQSDGSNSSVKNFSHQILKFGQVEPNLVLGRTIALKS